MKQVFNIKGIVMNEDFVSFSLAKKLKEKGFYYKCVSTYDNDGMLGYNYIQPTSIRAIGFDDCLCSHNVENDDCIDAPTISQVLKWLREKGIFIEIHVHATFATKNKVAYWCRICRNSNGVRIKQIDELEESYADYEKAAIAGIEYCLDNLI